MAFKDKELQKLSQDIINRAVQKQSGVATPSLIDNLRQLAQRTLRRPLK